MNYDVEMLNRIIVFFNEIDIKVSERQLSDDCILPGCDIQADVICYDKNKLLYPGDLLHEAGHLAMTEAKYRPLIGTKDMDPLWPTEADEIGAILWSWAALKKMDIPAEIVFHEQGYKGESSWLIEQFENKNYIGLPLLQWQGLCLDAAKAAQENTKPFPHMIKWLRS